MPGLIKILPVQVQYTRQTYNGLMAAYAEAGQTHKCRELQARMAAQDIRPDEVTYSCILRSYACAQPVVPVLAPVLRSACTQLLRVYGLTR